jgi:hypothetical protein
MQENEMPVPDKCSGPSDEDLNRRAVPVGDREHAVSFLRCRSAIMQGCSPFFTDSPRYCSIFNDFRSPSIREEIDGLLEPIPLFSAKLLLIFTQNRGAGASVEESLENEHQT